MSKDQKYNYDKAEADLYDVGANNSEEIFGCRSEKSFRSFMKENGLNPDRYIKSDSSKSSSDSKGSSGCYLTSACAVSRGLPDNCSELQTLRSFRDSYLAARPDGQSEINHYYQIAPGIVDSINRRDNHREIWNQIYGELVAPCVRMIHAQQNETAYRHYKAYSLELQKKYHN